MRGHAYITGLGVGMFISNNAASDGSPYLRGGFIAASILFSLWYIYRREDKKIDIKS